MSHPARLRSRLLFIVCDLQRAGDAEYGCDAPGRRGYKPRGWLRLCFGWAADFLDLTRIFCCGFLNFAVQKSVKSHLQSKLSRMFDVSRREVGRWELSYLSSLHCTSLVLEENISESPVRLRELRSVSRTIWSMCGPLTRCSVRRCKIMAVLVRYSFNSPSRSSEGSTGCANGMLGPSCLDLGRASDSLATSRAAWSIQDRITVSTDGDTGRAAMRPVSKTCTPGGIAMVQAGIVCKCTGAGPEYYESRPAETELVGGGELRKPVQDADVRLTRGHEHRHT